MAWRENAVFGNVTIEGALTADALVNVATAQDFGSTVDVTGATTLDSTLSVAGASTLTGAVTLGNIIKLKEHTVANAPSAATAGAGAVIYLSNGNAGAKCAAMSDGTNWKVIALGATAAGA